MLKILIIDKHPILYSGLSILLRRHFDVSEIASLPDISNYKPGTYNPNLIIIGLNDEIENRNLELIYYTRKTFPHIKIIIFDSNPCINSPHYFKIAPHGYLPKKAKTEEVIDCVTAVLNGNYYIHKESVAYFMNYFAKSNNSEPKFKITLSTKELEIAKYLASGMSTSSIAVTIKRKMSTVSTTKSKIYKKLNINNIVQLKKALDDIVYL